MIVVSDATPLNALIRIGEVDVLHKLFGSVLVPRAVFGELSRAETPNVVREWVLSQPAWFEVRSVSLPDASLPIKGRGEREAIQLAVETKADLLLVDDKKARSVAQRLGLRITGTIGVLELAATLGHTNLKLAFERLRETDFEVSEGLLQDALEREAKRRSET